MTTPRKAGTVAAYIHLLFIILLFYAICTGRLSPEGWLYAALVDLPVHFLLGFLSFIASDSLLSVPIFLFIWFGVLGSVQWFVIVWAIARWTTK